MLMSELWMASFKDFTQPSSGVTSKCIRGLELSLCNTAGVACCFVNNTTAAFHLAGPVFTVCPASAAQLAFTVSGTTAVGNIKKSQTVLRYNHRGSYYL